MELSWQIVWKSIIIVLSGILLVRLSGRKAIAQMSAATTVIMISVGALLAEGVIEKRVGGPLVSVAVFLFVLIVLEAIQMKNQLLYRLITGKSVTVIREGKVDKTQLRKLRMTSEQLEMRLRQKQVSRISDVKTATIEVNGEIGIELMRHAEPATVGELDKIIERVDLILAKINQSITTPDTPNILEEVKHTEAVDIPNRH